MKLLLRGIVVMVLVLSFVVQAKSGTQDTFDIVTIEKQLDSYMKYFSGDNPGAVVSVMKRGDLVLNRAFGLADVDTKKTMSTDMVFNLSNISKSFTSLAIMQLVDKGKLSLENSLLDIFNDFPAYGAGVKIKYLLNHTSGLVSYNSDSLNTNSEVLNFLKQQNKTEFESGSKFNYSNSEYALLVSIIEEVSKLSYQEFTTKYIFKKLKIENIFVDEFNGQNVNIVPGHFKEDNRYYPKITFSNIYGEQGLFMNSESFAKWDKALYSDKLLSCENLSKLFTLDVIDEKKPSYFGYGWVLMERDNTRYYWHGGGGTGYTTMVLHLPDTDLTVLILTNRNDGYDFLKMAIYVAKLFDKNIKL